MKQCLHLRLKLCISILNLDQMSNQQTDFQPCSILLGI